MLLIHDLVEIDAGDNPIHGDHDAAAVAAAEARAADRDLRAASGRPGAAAAGALGGVRGRRKPDDAVFAKSLTGPSR